MGFAEEVRSGTPRYKRLWVEEQLGDEADEFREALADPKVEARAIWRALKARGLDVSDRSVSSWCTAERR